MRTIDVYADTKGFNTCRGEHCGVRIMWAETLGGRRMCFTGEPVPVATAHDGDRRLIETYDFAANHWATCPDAKTFKRGPA